MPAAVELWGISIGTDWIQIVFGVLLVLAAIGCWFTNAFMLPGNWLILGLAAVFAYFFPPEEYGRGFGLITIIVLAVIAGLGELIEFAAGAAGAAQQGSSRRAMLLSMVGAIIGSIVGAAVGIPIPIIGSLAGAVGGAAAGAFGGAYLGEMWKGKLHPERTAVSTGALIGRLFGTIGKLAAGAIMVAVLAVMTFMPADMGGERSGEAGDRVLRTTSRLPEFLASRMATHQTSPSSLPLSSCAPVHWHEQLSSATVETSHISHAPTITILSPAT